MANSGRHIPRLRSVQSFQNATNILVQVGAFHLGKSVVQLLLEENVTEPVLRQALAIDAPEALRFHQLMISVQLTAQ